MSERWIDRARHLLVARAGPHGPVRQFTLPCDTLWANLSRVAARRPRHPALHGPDHSLTYAAYNEVARSAAARLADHGVAKGDRVGIVERNTLSFCVAVATCWALGAIAVPIHTRLKTPEIQRLLARVTPKAIIASHEFELSTEGAARIAPAELLAPAPSRRFSPTPELDPDATAFILFTSGTTGAAKGVRISHRNALQAAETFRFCYDLTAQDTTLIAAPIFHGTGLFAQLVPFLHIGGSIALIERFEPGDAITAALKHGVTHMVAAPPIYSRMLENIKQERPPFRILGVGGAPMPAGLFRALGEAFPQAAVLNSYGMTELTSPALINPPDRAADAPGSVGFPTPTLDVRLIEPANGDVVEGEGSGELQARGALVSPGYWDNPSAIAPGGWLPTGDIAVRDAAGAYRIADRVKDMVNVGGEKVYSIDLENALEADDAVAAAAVVGHPHPELGEVPVAFVVPSLGHAFDCDGLLARLATSLASFKLPRAIYVVEALPTSDTGKVQKSRLREIAAETAKI